MSGLLLGAIVMQLAGAASGIVERAPVRAGAEVSFHAMVSPETVFVGQAARYELGVFIRDDIRQRLRRNPEFVPPDLRGVFAYDLRESATMPSVVRHGATYVVHRFRRALYPVVPGRIDVPAARLTYTLPQGASFFSREDTRSLRSEAVSIVAIEPPLARRPSEWRGAIGDLRVSIVTVPARARQGDPFVFTVRVEGRGNVALWPRPSVEIPGATVVASDERVRVDSLPEELSGAKDFDFLVTPQHDGALALPVIAYHYFDPDRRSYRVSRTDARAVTVAATEMVPLASPDAPGAAVTPPRRIDPTWRGPAWPMPLSTWWYWTLASLLPVIALTRHWTRRWSGGRRPLPQRVALREAIAAADLAVARRIWQRSIEQRVGDRALAWADGGAVHRALRRAGVTSESATRVVAAAAALDAASFAPRRPSPAVALSELLVLLDAVDHEAVSPAGRGRGAAGAALLALTLLGAGPVAAQAPPTAAEAFAHGVALSSSDPAGAAAAFLNAARAAPTAVDAWRNAAIMSWAAGDTARAVVAWQRALRLAPLDATVREQLRRAGVTTTNPVATVWPVPATASAWCALLLWAMGWGWLARGRHRRRAVAALASALLLGGIAVLQHRRLTALDFGVVATPSPRRALPALGSEPGPAPLTGEVVAIIERGPVWVLVDAGDGRRGWMDARDVLGPDAQPLRD